MTPAEKSHFIKIHGRALGFDLIGITSPSPSTRGAYYRDWLKKGYAGTMRYLHRNVRFRANPADIVPDARSIICVAVNYRRPDGHLSPQDLNNAPEHQLGQPATGHVAQYARGRDYHTVLRRMLARLAEDLQTRFSAPFTRRAFVDTGPLLERDLAAAAGLGWIGKNTCLLNAERGSYLFLGEIFTSLELVPDEPVTERCARCTRCLDACPTGALVGPHELDARRCISYLTIEHRQAIAPDLRAQMGAWVFGCDICQQVCPYNAKAPLGTHPELQVQQLPHRLALAPLINLRSGDYRRLTRDSATRRARRNMWRRNALVVSGNYPGLDEATAAARQAATTDDDPLVRDAARNG